MTELARANRSPFDAIRLIDQDGEHWSGRQLMPLMDYSQWRDFAVMVEKAKASLELVQGRDAAAANFADMRKISATRPGADYRLTRFAAYLVAMAGDDTKRAVAEARIYFAVKTREAEMSASTPALPDITTPAGVLAMADMFATTARQLVAATDRIAELEPKADLADTYLIADGGTRLVREVAKLLQLREGELRRFLLDEKLIFAKHAPCGNVQYDLYAEHAHHFIATETIVNHTWGSCTHYTLRITPRGIDLIRKRLTAARAPALA